MNFPSVQIYQLAASYSFFQKSLRPEETTEKVSKLDDHEPDFSRIRCPLCKWRPAASDLWCCWECWYPERFFDGCGMEWNTFTTRGLCPGCGHQWYWTICLSCNDWSRHEDWYTRDKE